MLCRSGVIAVIVAAMGRTLEILKNDSVNKNHNFKNWKVCQSYFFQCFIDSYAIISTPVTFHLDTKSQNYIFVQITARISKKLGCEKNKALSQKLIYQNVYTLEGK